MRRKIAAKETQSLKKKDKEDNLHKKHFFLFRYYSLEPRRARISRIAHVASYSDTSFSVESKHASRPFLRT